MSLHGSENGRTHFPKTFLIETFSKERFQGQILGLYFRKLLFQRTFLAVTLKYFDTARMYFDVFWYSQDVLWCILIQPGCTLMYFDTARMYFDVLWNTFMYSPLLSTTLLSLFISNQRHCVHCALYNLQCT